jgi:uncharacterized SAM-binding protein YcdF (DUF218 family)
MFFHLAKIFWLLIQPLNLAILLLATGIVAGLLRWRRLMTLGIFGGFLILILSAWTSLGHIMITPLEQRYVRPDPTPGHVEGIVVLGGGLEGAINLERGGYEVNSGGDRFIEAAALARRYPEARVVITGGVGELVIEGEGDGKTAPRLLEALGVSPDRLILETESRDTYENAIFTKRIVTPSPGETWLLVTSAYHMPRSMAIFRRAGFPVVAWPVDYRTSGREGVGLFVDNPLDSLQTTTTAVREWIGLVAYWLSGRIDSPFAETE